MVDRHGENDRIRIGLLGDKRGNGDSRRRILPERLKNNGWFRYTYCTQLLRNGKAVLRIRDDHHPAEHRGVVHAQRSLLQQGFLPKQGEQLLGVSFTR